MYLLYLYVPEKLYIIRVCVLMMCARFMAKRVSNWSSRWPRRFRSLKMISLLTLEVVCVIFFRLILSSTYCLLTCFEDMQASRAWLQGYLPRMLKCSKSFWIVLKNEKNALKSMEFCWSQLNVRWSGLEVWWPYFCSQICCRIVDKSLELLKNKAANCAVQ